MPARLGPTEGASMDSPPNMSAACPPAAALPAVPKLHVLITALQVSNLIKPVDTLSLSDAAVADFSR